MGLLLWRIRVWRGGGGEALEERRVQNVKPQLRSKFLRMVEEEVEVGFCVVCLSSIYLTLYKFIKMPAFRSKIEVDKSMF